MIANGPEKKEGKEGELAPELSPELRGAPRRMAVLDPRTIEHRVAEYGDLGAIPLPERWERGTMLIDRNIVDLVKALRGLGIDTISSCEGHIREGIPHAWVEMLATPEQEQRLRRAVGEFNASERINNFTQWILATTDAGTTLLRPCIDATNVAELVRQKQSAEGLANYIYDSHITKRESPRVVLPSFTFLPEESEFSRLRESLRNLGFICMREYTPPVVFTPPEEPPLWPWLLVHAHKGDTVRLAKILELFNEDTSIRWIAKRVTPMRIRIVAAPLDAATSAEQVYASSMMLAYFIR